MAAKNNKMSSNNSANKKTRQGSSINTKTYPKGGGPNGSTPSKLRTKKKSRGQGRR